jgi:transcriptional regulator of heat shock response
MDLRQQKILEAILDAFIHKALPVGSKHLYQEYDFGVSPATIRNDMAILEDEGYIMQPHTSAGRVPTSLAYRLFVDQLKTEQLVIRQAEHDIQVMRREYFLKKTKEKLYDGVSILAGVTGDISFATLPDKDHLFYIGIGNLLKKPEFSSDPEKTTQVIEVLENQLHSVLSEMSIGTEGSVYIGEENILPEFKSCSLLAIPYHYRGFKGVMGILGSTRMNYAYNLAALRLSVQLIAD